MKQALILMLTASLTLPACATTLANVPSGQGDIWRRHVEHVPIGSVVRVRTTSGERFTAVLLAADEMAIEISRKTRVPEPIRRVPFDEIARLEMVRGSDGVVAKAAAIGASIGAGTFFGLLLLMSAVWAD